MEQRRIPVPDQDTEQLTQFDKSISHWSGEKIKLDLQAKSMLENIDGLFQARQSLLEKIMADAGVEPARVVQMRPVMADGKLELAVLLKPAPPPTVVMPDGTPAVKPSAPLPAPETAAAVEPNPPGE